MARVTIMGLGAMGQAAAAAVLTAGHEVTVWNRTPGRGDALLGRGARRAAGVADAVAASELVLLMLLDTGAVRDVLNAAGADLRGRTMVNLVTSTPADARSVAASVRDRGAHALDGVMMTVPAMIGSAEATILYGGDRGAFEQHAGVLRDVAGNSPYLGSDAGLPALHDAGLLTLLYATMTGWLQAFGLVAANGLTASEFLPHATRWFREVVASADPAAIAQDVDRREYPDAIPSPVALNAAALRLLVEVHDQSGVDSGLVRAISRLADERVAAGRGADGFNSLVEAIRSPATA